MKTTRILGLVLIALLTIAPPLRADCAYTNCFGADLVATTSTADDIFWGAAPSGSDGAFAVWSVSGRTRVHRVRQTSAPPAYPVPDWTWPIDGLLLPAGPAGTTQSSQTIVEDGFGGCYVAWTESPAGTLRLVRLTSAGAVVAGWPAAGLVVNAGAPGNDKLPRLRLLPSGDVAIAFSRTSGSDSFLYVQRVSPAGILAWTAPGSLVSTAPVRVFPRNPLDRYAYDVVADLSNGMLVAFLPAAGGIRAQRVSFTGSIAPGWPVAGTALDAGTWFVDSDRPAVLADGAGGMVVAWAEARGGPLANDVLVTRVTTAGTISAGWPATGLVLAGDVGPNERLARLEYADGPGFLAVWSWSDGPTSGVNARWLGADGTTTPGAPFEITRHSWSLLDLRTSRVPGGDCLIFEVGTGGEAVWSGLEDGGRLLAGPAGNSYTCRDPDRLLLNGEILATPLGGIVLATIPRDATRTDYDVQAIGYFGRGDVRVNDTLTAPLQYPIVPRNAGGADLNNPVLVTPTLDGNQPTTHLNTTWVQCQAGGSPTVTRAVLLDREFGFLEKPLSHPGGVFGDFTEVYTYGLNEPVNFGEPPLTVRGGRHCLTAFYDTEDVWLEADETNNVWDGQFVWSPLPTQYEVPNARLAPPDVCPFHPQPSADGFRYDREPSYAWVAALAPDAGGDDYDLYVYDDYTGSESGFSNVVGTSFYGGNATDFVVGHYSGTPTTVYPAAVRYDVGSGGQEFTIDQNDARFRNGANGSTWNGMNLPADRLADVYEIFLNGGEALTLTLVRTGGSDPVEFAMFDSAPGGIYGRGFAVAYSTPIAPGVIAADFLTPATGWYPVVVYRPVGSASPSPISYSFYWGTNPTDAPDVSGAATPQLAFHGASPNPATTETRLTFDLPSAQSASLTIYDVSGRRVRRLVDGPQPAGRQSVSWDRRSDGGERVSAGVYFARFEAGAFADRKRIVLVN
ncbi:MAG: FlgD immunoglobulin-like domain containing protein [bacterium]